MGDYTDNDMEAFRTLAAFHDRAPHPKGSTPTPHGRAHESATTYAQSDLELFSQLLRPDGATRLVPDKPAQAPVPPSGIAPGPGLPVYTRADLVQFDRAVLSTNADLVQPSDGGAANSDAARPTVAGSYTSADLNAFAALTQFGAAPPSSAAAAARSASPQARAARPNEAAATPTIKIIDADQERARERGSLWDGTKPIKIVYSDAAYRRNSR